MQNKITSSVKKNYVLVKVNMQTDELLSDENIAEIFLAWKKGNRDKLLIDIRKMKLAEPSVLTDYGEVKTFVDTGYNRIEQIAVLDNSDREKANDFLETAAVNRGLNWKFFYDEKEAIDWLEAGEKNKL